LPHAGWASRPSVRSCPRFPQFRGPSNDARSD
jgi:hypothetical protein